MRIVDQQFFDALRKLKEKLRTNKEIAKRASISEVHVGRLLSGGVELLKNDTYARLFPLVQPYLGKNYQGVPHYNGGHLAEGAARYACPAGLSDMEKMLVRYFRLLPDDERLEFLMAIKAKVLPKES